MVTFDPMADLIDLRDVCEAADEELADVASELVSVAGETDEGETSTEARSFLRAVLSDLGYSTPEDDQEIIDQARSIADGYESTIIARRYFVEYAQDLADDLGLLSNGANPASGWPFYCIDWERAARELEADYSSFSFDGREYLIRSF